MKILSDRKMKKNTWLTSILKTFHCMHVWLWHICNRIYFTTIWATCICNYLTMHWLGLAYTKEQRKGTSLRHWAKQHARWHPRVHVKWNIMSGTYKILLNGQLSEQRKNFKSIQKTKKVCKQRLSIWQVAFVYSRLTCQCFGVHVIN